MEGDEGLRTIECLRGRLLAERAASKAANDESEQISKKLVELEKQLKIEIKSRNKAEKRLRFLMKKLNALNITYVSVDEYSSSVSGKSETSSVASSKSQPQIELLKHQSKCVKNNDTPCERHICPSHEDNLEASNEGISENYNEYVTQSSKKDGDEYDLQKEDNYGLRSFVKRNNNVNEERDQDTYHNVDNSMALIVVEDKSISTPRNDEDNNDVCDNSMALVMVNSTMKEQEKDVPVSNGNAKDVLDALRYARECLQASMGMRRHNKSYIAQHRLDRILC